MNGRTFHQRWPFLLPLPSPLSLSAPPPPTMPPEPTRPRCWCQPWQKNNEESKKSKQHSSGRLLLAASWETWESTKEERNQERRTATRGQDRVVVVYCNLPQHQCLVVHSLRINGFLWTRRTPTKKHKQAALSGSSVCRKIAFVAPPFRANTEIEAVSLILCNWLSVVVTVAHKQVWSGE